MMRVRRFEGSALSDAQEATYRAASLATVVEWVLEFAPFHQPREDKSLKGYRPEHYSPIGIIIQHVRSDFEYVTGQPLNTEDQIKDSTVMIHLKATMNPLSLEQTAFLDRCRHERARKVEAEIRTLLGPRKI